jgi:hypothetical protein
MQTNPFRFMREFWQIPAAIALALVLSSCATTGQGKAELSTLQREYFRVAMQPVPSNNPQAQAAKEKRLQDLMDQMFELRKIEKDLDLASRKSVEKEKARAGLPIDQPAVEVLEARVEPNPAPAGAQVYMICKYNAYGGGIDIPPTARLALVADGSVLAESNLTDNLYTGRNVVKPKLNIPAGQMPGLYEVRLRFTHGSDTADAIAPLEIVGVSQPVGSAATRSATEPNALHADLLRYLGELKSVEHMVTSAHGTLASIESSTHGVGLFGSRIKSDVVPAYTRYLIAVEAIAPGSAEIQRIHPTLVEGMRMQIDGLSTYADALSRNNSRQLEEAQARLAESKRLQLQWKSELEALGRKFNR